MVIGREQDSFNNIYKLSHATGKFENGADERLPHRGVRLDPL